MNGDLYNLLISGDENAWESDTKIFDLICEMDPMTGKLTENMFGISVNDVKNISLKKGLLKTKVKITFSDDSVILFKPNNFCIGLSNHKMNLLKLKEMYS
ncbi:hypothetical protein [Paenibacillus sp. KN14-4R]|uniref:hypothetical protein n=1 Tax=Paenibacillus sp. KN14-4R TaxID=3445773 RepID=UPI003FA0C53A